MSFFERETLPPGRAGRAGSAAKAGLKSYLLLHAILLLYAVTGIFYKLAAISPLFSAGFFINYAIICVFSAVYATAWQQVLKVLPLNTAYANRSVCIVWGFVLGWVIFSERVTAVMVIGSVLIVAGLLLMVSDDGKG